jgi:hypothetical protein
VPAADVSVAAGGIAAVVLAVAVAWVLLVPTADWLAHHDIGSARDRYCRRPGTPRWVGC